MDDCIEDCEPFNESCDTDCFIDYHNMIKVVVKYLYLNNCTFSRVPAWTIANLDVHVKMIITIAHFTQQLSQLPLPREQQLL